MSHDPKEPLSPEDNLRRLKEINEHLSSKLSKKRVILLEKKSRRDDCQSLLDETPPKDECSVEQLNTASRQEQILACTKIEIKDLEAEVRQLLGKIKWNEGKQRQVEEMMTRSEDLTYTLEAQLRSATAKLDEESE